MNYKASALFLSAALLGTALATSGTTTRQFPAAQVSTLRIGVDFHDIEVEVVPGERVSVVIETKLRGIVINPGALIPVASMSGGVLSVRSSGRLSVGFIGGHSGQVRVKLPPGKTLDLVSDSGHCQVRGLALGAALSCATDSGDIDIDAPARSVTLKSDSGNIKVSGSTPELTLSTDSGDIQVRRGGKLTVRSDSGNLDLAGLTGLLTASTDSGDISAAWSKAPTAGTLAVQSDSGNVRLNFPRGASYGGNLRSESGRVTVQRPAHQSQAGSLLQLSDAPLMLSVSSGSGDVTVQTQP